MHTMMWRSVVLTLGLAAFTPALAGNQPITFRTQQSYTVKPGDTLWGIAGHFLVHPWQWPQIWHKNTYIKNPNLIYPGERLVLRYTNGHPEMGVAHFVELSPKVSMSAIPSFNTGDVMPFLGSPGVTSSIHAFGKLPYIAAASKQRPVYVTGDTLYTVGLRKAAIGQKYTVVKLGNKLVNPKNGRVLGYTMADIGRVKVTQSGHHAAILVTQSLRPVNLGDRLIPFTEPSVPHYFPSKPSAVVHGYIIGQLSSEPALSTGQTVIISAGSDAGLKNGNTLYVDRTIHTTNALTGKAFAVPSTHLGDIMIFRVFKSVSYAVITQSKRGVRLGDSVTSVGN